jgi:hypothetical protein
MNCGSDEIFDCIAIVEDLEADEGDRGKTRVILCARGFSEISNLARVNLEI